MLSDDDDDCDDDVLEIQEGLPGQGLLHQRIQIVIGLLTTGKYTDIIARAAKLMADKKPAAGTPRYWVSLLRVDAPVTAYNRCSIR
jgi:hypothetical protein